MDDTAFVADSEKWSTLMMEFGRVRERRGRKLKVNVQISGIPGVNG